jgi:membrane protease YdiL (CAAX protease family)
LKYIAPEYSLTYTGGSVEQWRGFWTICVIPPLWEELYFRVLPFTILAIWMGRDKFEQAKLPIIGMLAIAFGLIHGGVANLFCQGVLGFALGWLYFQNGKSYLSAVALHFLWNVMAPVQMYLFFNLITVN